MVNEILHGKLLIEQYELHKKKGMDSWVPEVKAVPAPLVAPIVLVLLQTLLW